MIERPYPWFGGKTKIAEVVWNRLGDVPNYVEPFFGGGGLFLRRPHYPFDETVIRRETINDLDGHVANFWRAIDADPESVAGYASYLVSELDLHARGDWLYCRPESREFVELMRSDSDFYCAKTAGWWVWFVANWIGGLPAVEKNSHRTERNVHKRRPQLSRAGQGVSRKRPQLSRAGQGVDVKTAGLIHWFRQLQDRFRFTRVCCGDWARVCTKSVTWTNALTGVFLDPPYSGETGRKPDLYSEENLTVSNDVRTWCAAEGENPLMRIALCGYDTEHSDLEQIGWHVHEWRGGLGMAATTNNNRERERVWFSPHCLTQDHGLLWDKHAVPANIDETP